MRTKKLCGVEIKPSVFNHPPVYANTDHITSTSDHTLSDYTSSFNTDFNRTVSMKIHYSINLPINCNKKATNAYFPSRTFWEQK